MTVRSSPPPDFAPNLQVTDYVVRWTGSVQCGAEILKLEIGFPLSDPAAHRKTIECVWWAQEMARAADRKGLQRFWIDRHRGHPVSVVERV